MFRRVLNLSLIYSWLLFAMNCRGSVAAAGFTNETDRQALLAFKDLIQEDLFAALSSWNDSFHFCEWRGVTCGRQHQRVTALWLVSQNLVGSVSPHIGRLTFLKKIHLNNNSFHGTISPDIGHLFRQCDSTVNLRRMKCRWGETEIQGGLLILETSGERTGGDWGLGGGEGKEVVPD
ncbi:hypothetical protein RJ640_024701 [Escallonia rubra]|uniref:Leucine-rich repeat-containing N-terminal plant-type domain-containing protein n=1 Tax=Escallonia rubra TaxID=112253 RepID=A0AA88R4P5_9ASTE|nr:hypothetical protein RJ640_024701 [Escallonia rubra]